MRFTVENTSVDMEVKSYTESLTLESLVKQLWEKVRTAAERISQLKEENESFKTRMEHVEHELSKLHSDINQKEQEIRRLKQDHSQLTNAVGSNNVLTIEEKEALKERIKELIAKINSHL